MKNLKNNKKGFTLIELLAVIVILAILVAVAVPAVSRYLSQARRGTFASNANEAITQVRTDTSVTGYIGVAVYDLGAMNNLLQKKLENSPYGADYKNTSYVLAYIKSNGESFYWICLEDENGNGINATIEKDVASGVVYSSTDTGKSVACNVTSDITKMKSDLTNTTDQTAFTTAASNMKYAETFSDGTSTSYKAK